MTFYRLCLKKKKKCDSQTGRDLKNQQSEEASFKGKVGKERGSFRRRRPDRIHVWTQMFVDVEVTRLVFSPLCAPEALNLTLRYSNVFI